MKKPLDSHRRCDPRAGRSSPSHPPGEPPSSGEEIPRGRSRRPSERPRAARALLPRRPSTDATDR